MSGLTFSAANASVAALLPSAMGGVLTVLVTEQAYVPGKAIIKTSGAYVLGAEMVASPDRGTSELVLAASLLTTGAEGSSSSSNTNKNDGMFVKQKVFIHTHESLRNNFQKLEGFTMLLVCSLFFGHKVPSSSFRTLYMLRPVKNSSASLKITL